MKRAILIGAVLSALLSAGASAGAQATDAQVPPNLVPPAGNRLSSEFFAAGVQVYECVAEKWKNIEPAANLIGTAGTAVHFRGPSWESAVDGSLVETVVLLQPEGFPKSSPVQGSIPQLLLAATRNEGAAGTVFGQVTFVQRLATSGGVAPDESCVNGERLGAKYRAKYRFFVAG